MKTFTIKNIRDNALDLLTKQYQSAQLELYRWIDEQADNYYSVDVKGIGFNPLGERPWHNEKKVINENLYAEVRTNLAKNTFWAKAVRAQSTPFLNDPLDAVTKKLYENNGRPYDNNAGENAANIADIKLNTFLKQIEKNKNLNNSQKKAITEKIEQARVVNRILEAMAKQNFLEKAIEETVYALKQETLNNQKIQILNFKPLNRNNLSTTSEALQRHEESTILRKKLEEDEKNSARSLREVISNSKIQSEKEEALGQLKRQEKVKELIEQLDVLTKRYCDFCYENPIKLTLWEKFSQATKAVSLPVAALAALGAIGCGIGALFFAPLAIPAAYLLKISFVGLAPVVLDGANLVRNMYYGRMPLRESNSLTGAAIGMPLVMGSFLHFAVPALNSAQSSIIEPSKEIAKTVGVGLGQNSINILATIGNTLFSIFTLKFIRKRIQTAYSKDQIKEHKILNPNHAENHVSFIETQDVKPTLNANMTRNLLTLQDYKHAYEPSIQKLVQGEGGESTSKEATQVAKEAIYESKTKSGKTKYSNLYAFLIKNNDEKEGKQELNMPSNEANHKVIFIGSRYEKIVSTSLGRFSFFLSKNEKYIQNMLSQLKESVANESFAERKQKMIDLKSELEQHPEIKKYLQDKIKTRTNTLKLYLRVNKELDALNNIENNSDIKSTVLFSR